MSNPNNAYIEIASTGTDSEYTKVGYAVPVVVQSFISLIALGQFLIVHGAMPGKKHEKRQIKALTKVIRKSKALPVPAFNEMVESNKASIEFAFGQLKASLVGTFLEKKFATDTFITIHLESYKLGMENVVKGSKRGS
ncbi:MAG: hypothetical protein HRT61_09925 [Ekhidna sp.]|nr:hypothetical protein [Ekhidna sp.]